jgi:hypothetical protein
MTSATVPTYSESLRIGWTLLWRGTGSVLLLLILCNILILTVLPELQRTGPSLWAALFPVAIVICVATFGVMPCVARALFTASYNGFHVKLVRDTQPTTSRETASRQSPAIIDQH